MVCGFNKKFPPKIEDGTKKHTARHGKRWRAGMKMQMATGVRTKDYNCFKEVEVHGVQDMAIVYAKDEIGKCAKGIIPVVKIDGGVLDIKQIAELAINDGFVDVGEFFNWFDEDFDGQLIHWTDMRYIGKGGDAS